MARLTKTIVEKAEPKDKPYFVWCSDLPGFGVRVFPSGKRVYYIDYRNRDGSRKRMTIGPHGKITCEEARKLAMVTLGDVVKGEDPAEERRSRRTSLTVSQLCEDYFVAADKGLVIGRAGRPKKASTLTLDRSMVEAHIKPLLGKRLIIDLKRSDIQKFVGSVTAGKTAKAKPEKSGNLRGRIRRPGGPGAASRCTQTLGAILSWAVSQGVMEISPAAGVKKPATNKRERRLTADEFKALGTVFDETTANPFEAWQPVAELRLLALTGCRLGEVENLKWSEVDFEDSLLRLEDTKTGRSVRPLSEAAKDVLRSIKPKEGHPYVFPAERLQGRPFAGMKRAYRKLFVDAGLVGVTPHVLRHSFASVGADLGFTDSTIGAMLGHAGSGITSRYTHRLDSVLIAAANKVAEEISKQMRQQE
ncbi:tyrosine-type recombinase/integrase [Pleomorphomonas sp. PLEO]|uniref:tyrosine-type recombinase/integrase n=1 Tax=Pleomorphomonas sp. PLEO TaxID=3239306 RepID=UPI00351F2ABB